MTTTTPVPPAEGSGISLREVNYSYKTPAGPVPALCDVTVSFPGGCLSAILGPSGSGKSTLLQVISGILDVDQGTVKVGGEVVSGASERVRSRIRRQELGLVHQKSELVSLLTVGENVEVGGFGGRGSAAERRAAALCQLSRFGLQGMENRWPETLSGGQQQRVAIARSLCSPKQCLLADEPTGSLDTGNSRNVFEALVAASETGVGVVVVTHDPLVAEFADRIYELKDGILNEQ